MIEVVALVCTLQAPLRCKDVSLSSYLTDYDFVPTLGLEVIAGRNFSRDFPSDSAGVILNETAVQLIGWEDPVGQYMQYPGNGNQRFQVIGVVAPKGRVLVSSASSV